MVQIKIDPIDDKIKDGIYLEDSVEATIKIFTALGLDPSLVSARKEAEEC